MAQALGIDVGQQSIKIAVVDGTPKRVRVTRFIEHRLEPSVTTGTLGPDETGEILAQLFRTHALPTTSVVAAVPAQSCLTRDITVPFVKDDQIRKTIKFQAESYFHSIAIDELIVEHYKLEANPKEKAHLLIVGLKKDVLADRLRIFERAEIDPSAIDLDCAAIYNAYTLTPQAQGGRRTVIVDLGAQTLKIIVVEGGRLRAVRSTRAHASGIQLTDSQTGKKKKRRKSIDLESLKEEESADLFFADASAEGDEGRLPVVILDDEQTEIFDLADERLSDEARQSVLDKVFLEIDRTLAGTRLDGPLELIVLTGGGSALDGVERVFAEHFQVPAERLDLKGPIPARLSHEQTEAFQVGGATALGLALKGIGYDLVGFDFRKEEFAFQGRYEKAKRGLACTLVLFFLLFFSLAYRYEVVEKKNLVDQLQRLQTYQQDVYLTVFPEDQKRIPPDIAKAMKDRNLLLRKRYAVGQDAPEVISALDALREFAAGSEASGVKVTLREAQFQQGRSIVKASVATDSEVYAVKSAVLAKAKLFTVAGEQVTRAGKAGEERIDVDYQLEMKRPEKKRGG